MRGGFRGYLSRFRATRAWQHSSTPLRRWCPRWFNFSKKDKRRSPRVTGTSSVFSTKYLRGKVSWGLIKYFGNWRAMNCPTTNGRVRSSAIYRTFQHYRIKKLIFIKLSLHLGFLYGDIPTSVRVDGLGWFFQVAPQYRGPPLWACASLLRDHIAAKVVGHDSRALGNSSPVLKLHPQ